MILQSAQEKSDTQPGLNLTRGKEKKEEKNYCLIGRHFVQRMSFETNLNIILTGEEFTQKIRFFAISVKKIAFEAFQSVLIRKKEILTKMSRNY